MIKRAKGPLFTPYEKQVLTEKADGHMEILDNKCNNSKTIFLKQQTWNLITQEFNSTPGVTPRSKKQLKNLWKNMKCRAKYRTMASVRFLNTNYGDLNSGRNVMQQLPIPGVTDVESNESDFPVNFIIKEEPNGDESDGCAAQSTEQQSHDEMSLSDPASPERSRSPEAIENNTMTSIQTDATNSISEETQHNVQESSANVINARIPTYKAIQPKYPLNPAFQSQVRSTFAGIAINPTLQLSTASNESSANTFRQPPTTISHVKLNQSAGQSNKWRTEPAWTLKGPQNSDRILEMAETEHKRKMEILEKEHEQKLEMMEKEHRRKVELFSLKEEVLLLKKRRILNKLSAKNGSGGNITSNEMQPF